MLREALSATVGFPAVVVEEGGWRENAISGKCVCVTHLFSLLLRESESPLGQSPSRQGLP